MNAIKLSNTQITELCVLAEGTRTPAGPYEVATSSGKTLHYRTSREAFVAKRVLANDPGNGAVWVRPTNF